MRQLRFYISFELQIGNSYPLPEEKSRHLIQVLRLSAGDEFVLFNGDGHEYAAQLIHATKKVATVKIFNRTPVNRESLLQVHLLQGLSKGDRMDTSIQKCVELGVNLISPLYTARSNLKLNESRMAKKHAHWLKIIQSSCEQSGRNVLPKLQATEYFESIVEHYAHESALKLILSPLAEKGLAHLTCPMKAVVLLVGPEGGFSELELQFAEQCGFSSLSLGPRVLRTETAAMAGMAGIQAKWGGF